VEARQRLNGLHLDDDAVLNEKILPIAGVETPAFIDNRER